MRVRELNFVDSMIVSGGDDRMVNVWAEDTGELIHRLEEHKNNVLSVASSEQFIASGSENRTIKFNSRIDQWHSSMVCCNQLCLLG